ncbi:MAG: FKBP-type peptidyl-prolyl cis-trans isomerase [Oligoflexia bacterium]|nr:FKBP-type peptidyl-prolyl cis-trans isomerase [Oligoflexia bacterium]
MKLTLILISLIAVAACTKKPTTDKEKASYAVGQQIGNNIKQQTKDLDAKILAQSINDSLNDKKSTLTDEEMQAALMSFQKELMKQAQDKAQNSKAEGAAFLEKNKNEAGVKVTASGLQYKIIKSGNGAKPKKTDTVSAHYSGRFIDGKEFDSSYKRGEPTEFPVTGVIPGWTEALLMMHVGDKWQLFIPAELAYGDNSPPGIPPGSVLIFDISLEGIKKK